MIFPVPELVPGCRQVLAINAIPVIKQLVNQGYLPWELEELLYNRMQTLLLYYNQNLYLNDAIHITDKIT